MIILIKQIDEYQYSNRFLYKNDRYYYHRFLKLRIYSALTWQNSQNEKLAILIQYLSKI